MGSEAFVASGDKEKAERVSRNERPLAATIEAAEREAFVASGDKEKAERVSRNERPLVATIEAADAPAGAKPLPSVRQTFIKNSMKLYTGGEGAWKTGRICARSCGG